MHKPKELKVYCCANCMETEVKTTTPKIRGCKKSSFHHWIYLADKGTERYTCEVCGVKVNTYGVPAVMGCKDGQTHKWVKA